MRHACSQSVTLSAAHHLDAAGRPSRRHGHNYNLRVAVAGPLHQSGVVSPAEGLAARIVAAVAPFDYADLSAAIPDQLPSTANLAAALWSDLRGGLPPGAELFQIDLRESAAAGVALQAGDQSFVHRASFAAAHRTHAPALSDAENVARYGICNNPAGHGHNYRVVVWHPDPAPIPASVWAEFDHRNLSADIPDLRGRNVVTEALAELIARRAPGCRRVRVWETSDFFAEFLPTTGGYRLGRRRVFSAAHRVFDPILTAEANLHQYGQCGRGRTHGHDFLVEAVVAGRLDPLAETAFDLGQLDQALAAALQPLDHADLDQDVPELHELISTVDNLAGVIWRRLSAELGPALLRVRVCPTPTQASWVLRGEDG